jgi:hypothetical protein
MDAIENSACPAGTQATVDALYISCDEDLGELWEAGTKASMKTTVETYGCAGAAQSAPALFVALAAVANHFIN